MKNVLALLSSLVLAVAGCDNPPLTCGIFRYDEARMRCVCPEGTTELSDGSCMLPDGGVIFPPGLDAGPAMDVGAPPTDSGLEGGSDACSLLIFYRDADEDGAGDPSVSVEACSTPAGYVDNDDDCDDGCMGCLPGGTEVCDGHDNDCDESVDEGALTTYFRDADADTFGDPTMPTRACSMPAGFVENSDDCDDDCMACRPGGVEVCDAEMRDENCSMGPNEGCACTIGMVRPCPGGSDVGECRAGTQTCDGSGAWGACTGAVAPVMEACNGRDDDCNMLPDDGPAAISCGTATRATGVGCSAGSCFVSSCASGWRDCDSVFANGCEARLGTVSTCTTCGDACGFRCGVAGCLDAVDVVGGDAHTCALLSDRTVMCWGDDSFGQLGNDSSLSSRSLPAAVFGLSDVMEIDAGARHTCALRTDGSVLCWGEDTSGQLGNGSVTGNQPMPGVVAGLTSVTAIATGGSHTCAARTGGSVSCWGSDSFGQLGNGSATTGNQTSPVAASVTGATAITAGQSHTCALTAGVLRCWGSDSSGQLGNDAALASQTQPVAVATTSGLTGVVAIDAGGFFTCALTSAGRVFCWGADSNGQLGNDMATPTSVGTPVETTTSTGLSGVTAIVAGNAHACAVDGTGQLWCWGSDSAGQLGDGAPMTTQPTPVRVAIATGMTSSTIVAAGGSHSCAVAGGLVWCWGRNAQGQLGDGATTGRPEPARAVAP